MMAQIFHDLAHFAVLAFPNGHRQPGVACHLPVQTRANLAITDPVNRHPVGNIGKCRRVYMALHPYAIFAAPAGAWQFQMPCQPAIIGQQDQPFGIHIQPPHGQHARQLARQRIKDCLPVLFITVCDHQPARLVIAPEPCCLASGQGLAINCDRIGSGDIQRRACNQRTIDSHPAIKNPGLGLAARTQTGTRNMFGDAFRRIAAAVDGERRFSGHAVGVVGIGRLCKCGALCENSGMTVPSPRTDIMQHLLQEAAAAAALGEVPVAAAVTDAGGAIIAEACNSMRADGNALHHAEILAIEAAMNSLGQDRLDGFDLWVTLEPCTMCAGAIAHARIRRLYFGAYDPKAGAVESGIRFFDSPACHHRPDIYGGLSERAAAAQLQAFFASRR